MIKKNSIRCSITIIIGITLDLISKHFFYTLEYFKDSTLINPILNVWISRSLPIPFFIIIGISSIGIWIFFRLFKQKQINRQIAGLLIAGTIGNLVDRIFLWGVRDFINIGIFDFPIFNIADIMLNIGALLRIILQIKNNNKNNKKSVNKNSIEK